MKNKIKNLIKSILEIFATNDIQYIKKKITKYEYVSFDIFDTLIKRKCGKPENVFNIVEKEYNSRYSNNKITDFKKKRIKAEQLARSQTNKEEITIDEIYDNLNYNDKTKKILFRIEKDVELEECILKKEIYDVYKYCIENKKRVIIISDMYMTEKEIISILKKNNINNYDKLYLSSKMNKTKIKGTMFSEILKEINSRNIIHLGNHPISDYLMPKKNKIDAILIK